MSESSSAAASSTGAQAQERLYTADEVRVLMTRAVLLACAQLARDDFPPSEAAVVAQVLADDEADCG